MTKKELAIELATKMKKIRADINIERTAKVLYNGMTTHEIQKALESHYRKEQAI